MSPINLDELADLKTKMQAVIFSIDEGIVMTDFEGRILLLNDRAKGMLGIDKRYPYDRKFLDYIEAPEVRANLGTLLNSDEPSSQAEIIVPDGEVRILHATKNIVTTAQGAPLGKVMALRDVTIEKQLENLKDDFVHSITHDLKSPLTSVHGFLRLFMDGELGTVTEEQKRYYSIMIGSTEKLLRMIDNILDMAKLEAGKMVLHKAAWDVTATVDDILFSLQELAKHHKIRVSRKVVVRREGDALTFEHGTPVPPDQHIVVEADGTLLERVITNLIDNALKFTSAEGWVQIAVEEQPDRVQVSVSDNGRGIPADAIDKLFQKFQQVPGTKGGTGLGLTISRHIVEAHGGKISVESQRNRGSTFTFWIPKTAPGESA